MAIGVGEGLMMVGAGILIVYPIIVAILVDFLVIIAIFSSKGESRHPGFLTGFLLGSMFRNDYDYSYRSSPESTYIALVILAPLNAGLAVLLCLHLGMALPLALMICIGPLVGALGFVAVGAIIHHIPAEEAAKELVEGVQKAANDLERATKSLWAYLTQQKPAVGIGLLLGVSLAVGVALLFHFGLPFYAYAMGFATVGALILLGLGYIAKFAFEASNKAEGGAGGGKYPEVPHKQSRRPSHDFTPGNNQSYERLDPDKQPQRQGEPEPKPGTSPVERAEGELPRSDSDIEPGAPQ